MAKLSFVSGSLVLLPLALNASNLPVYGADCAGKINQPKASKLDAGFLTDKECKIIYVKPPRFGNMYITGISGGSQLGFCSGINKRLQAIDINEDTIKDETESIKQLMKNGDPDSIAQATEKSSFLDAFTEMQENSKNRFTANNSAVFGASVTFALENDWAQLISDYKNANKGIDVREMPLLGSCFTSTTTSGDSFSNYSNLMKLKIPNYIPGLDRAKNFGKLTEGDSLGFFGTSIGGNMDLNLFGVCPFYNTKDQTFEFAKSVSPDDKSKISNSFNGFFATNIIYYYPVQSEANFSVEANFTEVAEGFEKVIKTHKGPVTSFDVMKGLGIIKEKDGGNGKTLFVDKPANFEKIIKIIIEQDSHGVQLSDDQILRLTTTVVNSFVTQILNIIGTPTNSNNYDPVVGTENYQTEKKIKREFRHNWDSLGLHDYGKWVDVEYTVQTPVDEVAQTIKRWSTNVNISDAAYWKKLSTYTQHGTYTFLPK